MAVVVLKESGQTLQESFAKIFEHLNFIPKGKIFIKPNFSARPPIIPGENTDPEFLKELISFLIKHGAEEIIVGHGSLLGVADKQFPFDKIIKEGGFSFLRKIEGVKLLNLDREQKDRIEIGDFNFLIPKIILKEFNAYINLAKLKTHMETTVTLSLKNQMGLVSAIDRMNMHKGELEDCIARLGKAIKPTLSIIDAIVAMEGNGPHHGRGRRLNLLIAGDDMVEADSVACFLVNINFKNVKHISKAADLKVGLYPSPEYLLSIKQLRILDFKPATKCYKFLRNIYVWPTSACSSCITTLNECGKIIKKHPLKNFSLIKYILLSNKKINIIIGKGEGVNLSNKEKNIIIGKCAQCIAQKNNLSFLNKCPPTIKEVWEYINKELNK